MPMLSIVKPVNRIVLALPIALAALTLVSVNGSALPKRWTEVRAGWLFRSAQISAANVATVLRDQQLDLVIDLTDDPNDPDFAPEAAAARALGIRYLHAPVTPDVAEATASYAHAVAAMAQAHARGERVLVHCELGYRRSLAAIALYALLIEHEPREVAYRELYTYADGRPTWQPTMQKFIEQNLPELEARVAAELEESACASQPSCS
jgi:protein tyrosine phosphatase (PTP) superfamily phosphohydrolase (DUF442 family)